MDPIKVTLDRPREIRWTHRADARLGSLDRPPELRDIVSRNSRKAFFALCAFVWSALVDRETPFAEPTDLADHLGSVDAQNAAWEALRRALVEGGIIAEKKTSAPAASDSNPGPSQSSSSAQPVLGTTT